MTRNNLHQKSAIPIWKIVIFLAYNNVHNISLLEFMCLSFPTFDFLSVDISVKQGRKNSLVGILPEWKFYYLSDKKLGFVQRFL